MNSEIIIFAGSTTKNLALAQKINESLASEKVNSEVVNLVELNLPLYSTTEEKNGIPKAMLNNLDSFKNCKGMVFVLPEYNGGIPPVVTNFIAWTSRSSDNWRDVFNGKPALIASHSGGGGWHALMAIRSQLAYIGMNVLGRQIVVNGGKPLNEESLGDICKSLKAVLS